MLAGPSNGSADGSADATGAAAEETSATAAAAAAAAAVGGVTIDTGDVDFAARATGSIGALLERLDSLGLGEGKIELGEMDEFD